MLFLRARRPGRGDRLRAGAWQMIFAIVCVLPVPGGVLGPRALRTSQGVDHLDLVVVESLWEERNLALIRIKRLFGRHASNVTSVDRIAEWLVRTVGLPSADSITSVRVAPSSTMGRPRRKQAYP